MIVNVGLCSEWVTRQWHKYKKHSCVSLKTSAFFARHLLLVLALILTMNMHQGMWILLMHACIMHRSGVIERTWRCTKGGWQWSHKHDEHVLIGASVSTGVIGHMSTLDSDNEHVTLPLIYREMTNKFIHMTITMVQEVCSRRHKFPTCYKLDVKRGSCYYYYLQQQIFIVGRGKNNQGEERVPLYKVERRVDRAMIRCSENGFYKEARIISLWTTTTFHLKLVSFPRFSLL